MKLRRPAVGVALAAGLLLAGCTATGGADPGPTSPVASGSDGHTEVVRAEKRDIYRTVRLEGTVEALDPVSVTVPKAGRFTPVTAAKKARTVSKGQRLGTLRCPPAAAAEPTPAPSAATPATPPPACQLTVRASAAGRMPALTERDVAEGEAIGAVQPPGLRVRLPVTDATMLYAFKTPPRSGKAEIVGGPSGFTVTFDRRVYDKGSGQTTVYVRMPAKVEAFPGLKAIVVFVTDVQDDLLTLPLSAVRGRSGPGQVVSVDAQGAKAVVEVELGASDDTYVAVTGLDEQTDVLLYPLESDFGG